MRLQQICLSVYSQRAILLVVGLLGLPSCNSPSADTKPPAQVSESESGQIEKQASEESSASSDPFQLGNMLEPFDSPSLEELIAAHQWVDRPVVDAMERMRKEQAQLPAPEISVKEALELRNNTPEDNEKILDVFGRLAPADGSGADFKATISLLAQGDLKTTNPLLMSSAIDFDCNSFTGFGLFGFDRNLDKFASKDSVVSWQTSEDRMVDKVVLRDDLTWSDGKPITAHDIGYTFQVIMTDSVIIPAARQGTDQLRYVQAYGDHTIVFFHKEALATNDGNLNFPVIPKHIYEKTIPDDPTMTRSEAHSQLEDHPVVGGGYTLTKRVRGQEFVLTRRESSYMHEGKQVRDKPYFKTVRYKVIEDRNTALLALKAGKIDSQMLQTDQWESQTTGDDFYKHNTKATGVEWTSFHFCWNIEKTPFFKDVRVRKAMSYAMDYDEMLDTIFYGLYQQGQGTFHPTSKMFPREDAPELYRQDLDKAEQLLDEAGWIDTDGDGIRDKMIDGRRVPFRFTMLCYSVEERIRVVTLLKECLDQIGVVCLVKPLEFTVLSQQMDDGTFQAAFAGWGTGADPDTGTNIWVTNAGRNYGGYSNPRVDELFKQARHEFDPKKRSQLYGEIHKQLWEDQPYTWLFYRNSFYAFSKKLRGYNFSPRGPFHYSPGVSSFFMPAAMQ